MLLGRQKPDLAGAHNLISDWTTSSTTSFSCLLPTPLLLLLLLLLQKHIGRGPVCGRSVDVGGFNALAYELGSWFTPCLWSDEECQR
jgi:hypothetical protein